MTAAHVKPIAILPRIFTRSEEKAKEEVTFYKGVGEFESKADACGAYLCLVPVEGDQTILTVFETYDTREYVMNNHRSSDAYLKLQDHVKQSDTRDGPIEINIYRPNAGFTQREQASQVPVKDQFIWIAKLKAHPGKRDELIKVILTHATNVERDEEETLTFLVLESSDDADAVVLFERYTSEKYFREVHFASKSMAEYREKMQPFLAERNSEGYRAIAGFIDKREGLI